jgi:hypothetical protein
MAATVDANMSDPARTATQSVEADVGPDQVFALLSDPTRLPDWAPGFAERVDRSPDGSWQVTRDTEQFALRVLARSDTRTVDFLRTLAPGREAGAYVRVVPRPGRGAVITMTVPVPPGRERAEVAGDVLGELQALVDLLAGT